MTNNGKATGGIVLTVIVAALMVLSVALVAAAAVPTAYGASGSAASASVPTVAGAAPPPPTATGTVTYNPTTFGTASSTLVVANGGTFGSGSTVYIYASTTIAASGITDTVTPLNGAAGTTLPGGASSFSSTVIKFTIAVPATTLYLLASDSDPSTAGGAQFTTASAISVVGTQPAVVGPGTLTNAVTVGSTATITGSGWDAGATVVVTLNSPGGTPQFATATVLANTNFVATFTVPAMSGTVNLAGGVIAPTYNVVVQETNAISASFPQGGITTDTTMDVAPSITISPGSFSGASGTVFSITGAGFVASQAIAASTVATPTDSIAIGSSATPGADTLTYHSAVSVGTTGAFTVSATLSAAIVGSATVGPQYVVISATTPTAANAFLDAVYVSAPNPSALGFVFAVSGTAYPGNSVTAAVWNFPAGATVTVSLGPAVVGTITTDANGFGELPASAVVPAMPAASYAPVAADVAAGLYVTAPSVAVTAFFSVLDPAGSYLTVTAAEYFPSAGVYTVEGYGLSPSSTYAPTDSGASGSAGIVSVSVGSENAAGAAVYPALNGTAIFSYTPAYAGVTTGTTKTVALGAVTAAPAAFGYVEFGAPGFTAPTTYEIYASGATGQSLSLNNLIPDGATVYPGSAGVPAASYEYSAYFASTLLSFGVTPSPVFHGTGAAPATFSSTFTVPTLANGVYAVSIVSAGTPVSAALNAQSVVVSTTGASVSAGQLLLIPNVAGMGYDAVGVGLLGSATSWTLEWMTSSGLSSFTETVVTSGAFANTASLAGILSTAEPAGSYGIFLKQTTATATGFIYPSPSTYTVTAVLTMAGNEPTTCTTLNPCGDIGSSVIWSASGLSAYGFYDLYFNGAGAAYASGAPVTQVQAGGTGSISAPSDFAVPTMAPGVYTVTLDVSGTTTVAVSAAFEVAPSPSITLSAQPSAFPGQLVNFAWTPATAPTIGVASIEVTVLLNGTAFTTFPAADKAGTLSGSFLMPNAPPGSSWFLQLEWSQTTVSAGGSVYSSYTSTGQIYLQLVPGSGAFVLSISQTDMAHIATLSGANVNITLANLGAKISGIYAVGNKTFASLTTGFGNMTTSLSAIDATVTANAAGIANIQNGLVTIDSTLGTMTAALSAIGATVTTVSDNVIVLSTTLGQMNTTLTALNANVASVAGGVATLTTDVGQMQVSLSAIGAQLTTVTGDIATISSTLGTMTATLNSIDTTVTNTQAAVNIAVGDLVVVNSDLGSINGTVLSINGGIATIQTSLGKLQTSVNQIPTVPPATTSDLSTLSTLLYVVIVLVIITLALAAVLLTRAGRRPPSEPPRAFEAPKTP